MAKGSCPSDLFIGTHACFTAFTLSYQRMKQSQQKLCCGLDVETLRALCRAYVDAMSCVDEVKSQCPVEKHRDIEKALVNLDGAREELNGLCSDDTIIENYAMYQSCLTTAGPASESCLVRHLERRGRQLGSEGTRIRFLNLVQANTMEVFCRKLRSTISCVQQNVQQECGQQAATLVPSLVRPMVRYSATCVSEHPKQRPTKRPFLLDNAFVNDDELVDRGSRSSSGYRSNNGNNKNISKGNKNIKTERDNRSSSRNSGEDGATLSRKPKSKPNARNSSLHSAFNFYTVFYLFAITLTVYLL
ncbi:hypothetical protein ElyMa_000915900 [Elysia marginata]|uniref:Uncharacterized protein n=1 Tax=Elysia marginata TaxID=1093978 RepID=A0AAV4H8P5_9GAST|nr:hypothetical protein ElyMa_000915900 [Elysia marginata]